MLLDLDGYDREEMDQIEAKITEDFFKQKIRNIIKYVDLYAPEKYKKYFHEYRAARKRLRNQGIIV